MNKLNRYIAIHFLLSCLMWAPPPLRAQVPFTCEGQVFVLSATTPELAGLSISPANSAVSFSTIFSSLPVAIGALGFRSTDGFLYGISLGGQQLYRIGSDGAVENLGALALNPALDYLAGDISPNGRYFTAVGSANGAGQALIRVDLEDPGLAVQSVPLTGSLRIPDIAYAPLTGGLYGYESVGRRFLTINPTTGATAMLSAVLEAQHEAQGVFFDAFGRLYAYGSTSFGVASALFVIDKNSGQAVRRQTGPVYPVGEMASCPYTAAVECLVRPASTFPCSEIKYVYTLGNGVGPLTGISLEHPLPPGFTFTGLVRNPYGGVLSPVAPAGVFRLDNMSAPKGVDSIIITVEIGDIGGGGYKSRALLGGLPQALGSARPSDDPATLAPSDSTAIIVNRIEEDSLFYERFLCLGQSTVLDAGAFGGNVLWNDGTTSPQKAVSAEGVYTLEAASGCQAIFVSYTVTVASCPYTIELTHQILPEETFPCNEAVFRYGIGNDSGLERAGAFLVDTLPEGITVVGIERNPFGGSLDVAAPPGILRIDGLTLPLGVDSIDVRVAIGDVAPGDYYNSALLGGLPSALGPTRLSDDPRTPLADSTPVKILGVESDTAYISQLLCNDRPLVLDGSQYGASYLWADGSTGARFTATFPGLYPLQVFDGCRPSYVFFDVVAGEGIDTRFAEEKVKIHLGETYLLEPALINEGVGLFVEWDDPLGSSLSCLDCLMPLAKPLDHVVYTLRVSNGVCADTARITFLVDKSRRVYAPTAFSPNGDGRNDTFYLQSPDYGLLRSLTIYGRWGGMVFYTEAGALNEPQTGWDGQSHGKPAPAGLYLWKAEIEFIGEIREIFSGELSLLR
ncbi:MAG: gliding motility-associated C-terminal domain-containing protein [Phaeodactylibacter sp.]|nr:gliding motility-associated C-terminal domain-containing protein [Phaeodactylibacter sp.]MCB9273570.1 gliding motility-associated C-terminal domain-containing protein [Lewinellaceae bacterium]